MAQMVAMQHVQGVKPTRSASASFVTRSSRPCRAAVVPVRAAADSNSNAQGGVDRRSLLLGLAAGSLVAAQPIPAAYADGEIATFYGLATPPTSYGGYGGNANEKPKYAFEYPMGWKTDTINKVEKGTQGIDGRVYNPRNKQEQVFVITLSRMGEDANFALRDIDSTFAGFAGADYDLQDALTVATNRTSNKRQKDGQEFFEVEIDSPDVTYLSSITVAQGKVYAMFVKSPTKAFKNNEAKYRDIVQSFRLL